MNSELRPTRTRHPATRIGGLLCLLAAFVIADCSRGRAASPAQDNTPSPSSRAPVRLYASLVRGMPVYENPDRSSARVATIAFDEAVDVSEYQDAAYKECMERWARLASGGWALSYYLGEAPAKAEAPTAEADPLVGDWETLSGESFSFQSDGSCQAGLPSPEDSLIAWLSAPRGTDLEGWGGPPQIPVKEWSSVSLTSRRMVLDDETLNFRVAFWLKDGVRYAAGEGSCAIERTAFFLRCSMRSSR